MGIAADIVIRIRPEAYRASFGSLGADIDQMMTQLLRWRTNEPKTGAISPDGSIGGVPSDS